MYQLIEESYKEYIKEMFKVYVTDIRLAKGDIKKEKGADESFLEELTSLDRAKKKMIKIIEKLWEQ